MNIFHLVKKYFNFNFKNDCTVNLWLSLTNLLGIFSIYNFIFHKRYILATMLTELVIISSLHHLIETNEVAHRLTPVNLSIINKLGYQLRIIDITSACLFTLLILYFYKINIIYLFITNYTSIFILGMTSSFLCDFVIKEDRIFYLLFHSVWHICVYYIIYNLSLVIDY